MMTVKRYGGQFRGAEGRQSTENFRAVKLFYMILSSCLHVIKDLSKSIECAPEVNSNVNYGL